MSNITRKEKGKKKVTTFEHENSLGSNRKYYNNLFSVDLYNAICCLVC